MLDILLYKYNHKEKCKAYDFRDLNFLFKIKYLSSSFNLHVFVWKKKIAIFCFSYNSYDKVSFIIGRMVFFHKFKTVIILNNL